MYTNLWFLPDPERCEVSTAEKSFDADPLSVLTHGELSPTTGTFLCPLFTCILSSQYRGFACFRLLTWPSSCRANVCREVYIGIVLN